MQKMWRYTNYEHGGIVFADTIQEAEAKLKAKYGTDDFVVWLWDIDDYCDPDNPDVIDCY